MRRGNRSHLDISGVQRLRSLLTASLSFAGVCLLALVLFYSQSEETLVQGPQVYVVKTPARGPAFEELPELAQSRTLLGRLRQKKNPDAAAQSERIRLEKEIGLQEAISDVKARLQTADAMTDAARLACEEKLSRMEAELQASKMIMH